MLHSTAMDDTEEALMKRAYAAYYRAGGEPQPSTHRSGVESHAHLKYVVLRDDKGVIGVYRVRNDGVLKGMKRWPAPIK